MAEEQDKAGAPTPGPYQAGLDTPETANNNPDKRLVWANSLLVADCRSQWIPQEEAEANARLFAASLDLLAIARAVVWESAAFGRVTLDTYGKARHAVARAKGGAL